MSRIRPRLTFANVVSVLALFVALGGSATAAVLITGKQVKDSSLTGADVRNGSLTGSDLKKNSVGSLAIKDGDLLASDFKPGQLPAGVPGAQGPKGDTGASGATGAAGSVGAPGVSNYERVTGPLQSNPAGDQTLGSADCPPGKSVLGGGVEGTGTTAQSVNSSWPQSATTWKALVNNTSGSAAGFFVYAICAVVK